MNMKARDKRDGRYCTLIRIEESDIMMTVDLIHRYGYGVAFDEKTNRLVIATNGEAYFVEIGGCVALYGRREIYICDADGAREFVMNYELQRQARISREANDVILSFDDVKELERLCMLILKQDALATQKSFYLALPDGKSLKGKLCFKVIDRRN